MANTFSFVDGLLISGAMISDFEPNTIWIDNPVYTRWGAYNWTRFSPDFIKMKVPKKEVSPSIPMKRLQPD
ncbi:MAG: hypothetical protein QME61_03380 [Patescibacteria group bacterium]|nr:hypothetical protein [Patescibacteria group bacterium]